MSVASVRSRAINYFTIWELAHRKTELTTEIWAKLETVSDDLTKPINSRDIGLLGYIEYLNVEVNSVWTDVARSFDKFLYPEDIILEKGSPEYPRRLAQLPVKGDAPQFLFARGNVAFLDEAALAVVGTRSPTDEGRRRAKKLGYLLAQRGIVVASGLALGIDEAAHLGALEVGGATLAVLGTPLHRSYPSEHSQLQRLIGIAGTVVTQFYPGAGIRRFHFPMRNALMSGLCEGTVVVEASETSGALIQARKCMQQGRRLFIPQSALDNPAISWPKRFLSQGAMRFSTIEEVLNAIDDYLPEPPNDLTPRRTQALCSSKLMTSTP
ncbi:MAG: DNA-processing protein DprA [Bacillota bacterium]